METDVTKSWHFEFYGGVTGVFFGFRHHLVVDIGDLDPLGTGVPNFGATVKLTL